MDNSAATHEACSSGRMSQDYPEMMRHCRGLYQASRPVHLSAILSALRFIPAQEKPEI